MDVQERVVIMFCPESVVMTQVYECSVQPDLSCDFWNHFEADIARAHSMGCTAFRFSIEWHHVVPQKGRIDRDAIARYHAMLDVFEK